MKTVTGFAIFADNKPVKIELCDDVAGGLAISDPFPIFDDAEDAEAAFHNHAGLFGSEGKGQIVKVEVVIKEIVKDNITPSEYDEESDD